MISTQENGNDGAISNEMSRRRVLAGFGAAGLAGGFTHLLTGGTDPARAAEGEHPYLDAREFSAIDPTGKTECGKTFEEAMTQAIASKLKLYLPAGTYLLKSVILQSGLHLFGDPGFTTKLHFPIDEVGSIMGTGTSGKSADDLLFEDICWDGQQQLRKVSTQNALLKAYNARRWTLRRCKIVNSPSYGFGWQGTPSDADPDKRGPQTDLLMDEVYLHDNGYIGGTLGVPHSGTPNSMDNLDTKSGERVLMNRVYSTGASDKGINVRARYATFVNCIAENNLVGWDLNAAEPNPGAGIPDTDSHFTVLGGAARGNLTSGLTITCTPPGSATYAEVHGFHATENTDHGLRTNTPGEGSSVHLNVLGGHFTDNSGHGVWALDARTFSCSGATALRNKEYGIFVEKTPGATISNCTVEESEGESGIRAHESGGGAIHGNVSNENERGIYATEHIGGAISGNTCNGNVHHGIVVLGTSNNVDITHNTLLGNGGPIGVDGAKSIAYPNVTDSTAIPKVTAAAEMTLSTISDVLKVTGTTEITSIAPGRIGRRVTLTFNHAVTLKDGGNLLLAGTLNATPATVLTLVCNGPNWIETGRATV
jgi:parallel beta-helix repeat protein